MTSYDYLLKVVILGYRGCGKTAIADSMVKTEHRDEYIPTVGVDFRSYAMSFRKTHRVKMHIWDTSGDPTFRQIIESYCSGVACAIIVFDVTNRDSFDDVYRRTVDFRSSTSCRGHTHPLFLIANKTDLSNRRVVSKEEGLQLANELGLRYMETSAISKMNTDELRELVVARVFENLIDRNINCKGVNTTKDEVSLKITSGDTYIRLDHVKRKYQMPRCCVIM